jgi:hypothetical protein
MMGDRAPAHNGRARLPHAHGESAMDTALPRV